MMGQNLGVNASPNGLRRWADRIEAGRSLHNEWGGNARGAMLDGDSLKITVNMDKNATSFEGAKIDDYVRISVRDTGSGMRPATVAKASVVLVASGYSDLPDIPFPRISKSFASAHLVGRVRMLVEADIFKQWCAMAAHAQS